MINVESAFLYGDIEEELDMKIPKRAKHFMQVKDEDCVVLDKALYSPVQAARQWWKKFVRVLKLISFTWCKSDVCLLVRVNQDGIIVLFFISTILNVLETKQQSP